jgi:hypothetical protein
MSKQVATRRFCPGLWATIRATGENVKIESWAGAEEVYRVLSRRNGLQFIPETELDEIETHPLAHLGKTFGRCQVAGCGAPLTTGLPTCATCSAPICSCGRCRCSRTGSKKRRQGTRGKGQRAEGAS